MLHSAEPTFFETTVPMSIFIIYFIGDWYLPFQNNSTIVTELQRDPIGSL